MWEIKVFLYFTCSKPNRLTLFLLKTAKSALHWVSRRIDEVLFDQISEWRKRFIINDSHAEFSRNILFETQSTEYTQAWVSSNHLLCLSGSRLINGFQSPPGILSYFGHSTKLLLNWRKPESDNVNYNKNTPKMIINNPEGTGMIKDGEDEHGLQTMMNLKNLGLTFQDTQACRDVHL